MTVTGINGISYRLDTSPIGSGGEGNVYLAFITKVAKIYKPDMSVQELEEKLKIMIERPPNASVLSQVAWPLDIAYDEKGQCCGFVMPELQINTELSEVYKYPSTLPITAQQKVNIAQNICVVISEVHKEGYVFGDFNPRNIGLDINTGLVSFLDTDTYHVVDPIIGKTYRCNVCAPGYTAPELLAKCADYIIENPSASRNAYALTPLPTFTQETDYFALAIHIFKLLMNGYTPFGGIIETASVSLSSPGVGDAAVRRDSYCFRPGYKPQAAAIPLLETLSEEIAELFTKAFVEGKVNPRKRPTAVEWHGALTRHEKQLVTCPYNNLHQFDKKNKLCPLCEADRRFRTAMSGDSTAGTLKQVSYTPPAEVLQIATPTPTQPFCPWEGLARRVAQGKNSPPVSVPKSNTMQTTQNRQSLIKYSEGCTISAGLAHSIIVFSDGQLWAWGSNEVGQLGIGNNEGSLYPALVMENVESVSAGRNHTMVIAKDGSLWGFGNSRFGQIGDGSISEIRPVPVQIMKDVVSVSVGSNHTLAVKINGSLWAWGDNEYGQIGDGSTNTRLIPVKIMDGIISVSAGANHSAAISTDNKLLVWGCNKFGQVGKSYVSSINERYLTPVRTMDNVRCVSAGGYHTMAITTDGKLWTMGQNKYGQLGDGTKECHYQPAHILDNVVAVSAGDSHTMAITADYKLWTWGCNKYGQLGDNTKKHQYIPAKRKLSVVSVSAGVNHSIALTITGELFAWGSNNQGQLGDGDIYRRCLSPIKIISSNNKNKFL
jgi:alpha-tubulin suppressor-like RCC1 family protein